jgi:hypothetical protein
VPLGVAVSEISDLNIIPRVLGQSLRPQFATDVDDFAETCDSNKQSRNPGPAFCAGLLVDLRL